MFILRDLLRPLQTQFSDSRLGRVRAHWFAFTLLAIISPFTSSMTSNLLRSLTQVWRQAWGGIDVGGLPPGASADRLGVPIRQAAGGAGL